jgi:hypothetical protein
MNRFRGHTHERESISSLMSGRKMAIITQPYDRSVTLPEAVCALPAHRGKGAGARGKRENAISTGGQKLL